jgi:CheY-like chemotaxis protein
VARILLIDDSTEQRELFARLLHYNGFEVEQAATAEAGLAAAAQRRPDLILIEYVLPGMDGLEATKLLKKGRDTADIPVICISAREIPASAIRESRVNGYLRKPLRADTLIRSARSVIKSDETRPVGTEATSTVLLIASPGSAVAQSVAASFRLEGFNIVRTLETGLTARAAITPDVVVADLNATILEGWSLLRRMRSQPSIANGPAFAFSDTPSVEQELQALQAGFDAYLRDVDRASIAAEIERHVTPHIKKSTT